MKKTRKRVLPLQKQFRAMDLKTRNFVENLTDEERKEFSTFMALKYVGNVEGIQDLQTWYLTVTNDRVNKNFFSLGKHPKLQWLLCTTVSPDMGSHNHYWLGVAKKGSKKIHRFFELLYPLASEKEIDLLVSINSIESVKDYARQLGWDDKRISDEL